MLASVIQLRPQLNDRVFVREGVFRERPSEEFLTRLEEILGTRRPGGASDRDVLAPDFVNGRVAALRSGYHAEESL